MTDLKVKKCIGREPSHLFGIPDSPCEGELREAIGASKLIEWRKDDNFEGYYDCYICLKCGLTYHFNIKEGGEDGQKNSGEVR